MKPPSLNKSLSASWVAYRLHNEITESLGRFIYSTMTEHFDRFIVFEGLNVSRVMIPSLEEEPK